MAAQKQLDLLSAVESIADKAAGTELSREFYRRADRYIRYLAERMNLTKDQAVMLALFIDNCTDFNITIADFGRQLGCHTARLIRHMADIDVLEQRGLVRCMRKRQNLSYRVPLEVVEAFKRNEVYQPKDVSGLTCQGLFVELAEIFEMRSEDELTYEGTVDMVNHLLDSNKDLIFVQKFRSYKMGERGHMLLLLFCHLFVNNHDDNIMPSDLDFLYDRRTWGFVHNLLTEGRHILLQEKIIEYNNNDGFADRESYRLTTQAKRELFAELNLKSLRHSAKRNDLLRVENIVAKDLYYDASIQKQIDELVGLLDDTQYRQIRQRMKDSGFRSGFACLFYGAPGTGKTETVLQLARRTGRDIMQVDVSQIKSMWVGESEKNIKQLFDTYRARVAECERTPILLFNEADAIISKRRQGAERSVDKMENAIQNIILQEMETLDGILIATTNLERNMDKAFERRFLYKVRFERPTADARALMWRAMIPSLTDEEAHTLAAKYDFSGGQIENIARHYAISRILHGESEDVVARLSDYCDTERLEKHAHPTVGFRVA